MALNTRPGMPTRQQILEYIEATSQQVGKREIAKAFGLHGQEKILLKALLKDMADEGLIDIGPGRAFHKMGGVPRVTVLRVVEVDERATRALHRVLAVDDRARDLARTQGPSHGGREPPARTRRTHPRPSRLTSPGCPIRARRW